MSVYKITCETGKVYYGSTNNDIDTRTNKGWYHCACKDFINPKVEVIEKVEDTTQLYERELHYIRNYECVNVSGKGFDRKKWNAENKEKREQYRLKSEMNCQVWVKFNCDVCGRETNKKHYARHCKSKYHLSKGTTPLMGLKDPITTDSGNSNS